MNETATHLMRILFPLIVMRANMLLNCILQGLKLCIIVGRFPGLQGLTNEGSGSCELDPSWHRFVGPATRIKLSN